MKTTATVIKTELSLPSVDVTLEYSKDHCKQIPSPFSSGGDVIKYKVYISVNSNKISIGYHGSIHDCASHERKQLAYFNSRKEDTIVDKYLKFSRYPDFPYDFSKEDKDAAQLFVSNARALLNGKLSFSDVKQLHQGSHPKLLALTSEITYMDEEGLKYAFRSFISDAIAGAMTLDDFQNEFGYEKASTCLEVHNACKSFLEDVTIVLKIKEDDLYDIINELSEAGIE